MISVNIHLVDDDLAGGYELCALPAIGEAVVFEHPFGDGTEFRVVDIVHQVGAGNGHLVTIKVARPAPANQTR